ncbi:hypothetical protein QKT49_gp108 [Acanthamoeba castellanii medusavirus]|uniref:Uncharacterized protein n=1 Tax=Acanthamoeba castellanii medusavirus J1 TaxID=3114988 RepID=A0A3T1CWQ3_9VIRU|nr:hypothetical protein QKT49_gp108 [Acanthamoeba castellanii medusavirus]BBI30248.1 hypothetical protein [Acanthamoeba castellanii medusavirus J1]
MQNPKRARSESVSPNGISTFTVITRDGVHFPFDVSPGQFVTENYPHFRVVGAGSELVDISANDFRPLHVALTSLPLDRASDLLYQKGMVAVCAFLAAADEPLNLWYCRCLETATQLNIVGLLDAIQRVYVKHNTYINDSIEKHVPTTFRVDGFVDVVWKFNMRRVGADRAAGVIDALIGGPCDKTVEVVLPRLRGTERAPVRKESERSQAWCQFRDSLPARFNHDYDGAVAMVAKLLESWRPFLELTRSAYTMPGLYDRALAYAAADKHPDAGQALRAPLAAMELVDAVELDNPFHLFAAMSGNVGWWTGPASDLLFSAYKHDAKIVSLVLDAEARFSSNLPRMCGRNNRICLEAQLARAALKHIPGVSASDFTARLTNDYFGHWPYYER